MPMKIIQRVLLGFKGIQGSVISSLILLVTAGFASGATLTHRYSFDTDASDSVGGADGVLQGNAVVANGALVLDGTNSSAQLPNDLFSNYSSISFEIWYADAAVGNPNNRLYSFSGAQGSMSYLLFGQGSHAVGSSANIVNLRSPAVGGTNHLIWVEDADAQMARIYINGLLAASNGSFTITPAMIGSTTTNLLGAGATNVVMSNFKGSILEFRTYQGALSVLDAAVLDAFGPDQPETVPGTLQEVRLAIPSPTGPGAIFRAGVFADFSDVTNVNVSAQPDLVLASDNTNVVVITPDQRIMTVAMGTANVTAVWQGFSNTVPVTVGMPHDIALVHRYSFNEQTNDWIVHDSVSGANGQVFNTGSHPPTNAVFTGTGQLKLSGGYSNGGTKGGYAVLPPGLISSLSEVTIEAWVIWTPGKLPLTYGNGAWQRIFDFGQEGSGRPISYLFLTPATDNVSFTTNSVLHSAITTNYNNNETPRLNWTKALVTNVLCQVVIGYSPVRGIMKMYVDGVPVASGEAVIPLSGIVDTNCYLGRSLFSSDAYFFGSFEEFRIYSGLLTDAEVAANHAAGPHALGVDFILREYPPNSGQTNAVTVSWGPSATNLVLKASPALGTAAAWTPVSTLPTLQINRDIVTLPTTNGASFFQLRSP